MYCKLQQGRYAPPCVIGWRPKYFEVIICQVGTLFETLHELVFIWSSQFISLFYHSSIPIWTMWKRNPWKSRVFCCFGYYPSSHSLDFGSTPFMKLQLCPFIKIIWDTNQIRIVHHAFLFSNHTKSHTHTPTLEAAKHFLKYQIKQKWRRNFNRFD